jgi:hypothetical protein
MSEYFPDLSVFYSSYSTVKIIFMYQEIKKVRYIPVGFNLCLLSNIHLPISLYFAILVLLI